MSPTVLVRLAVGLLIVLLVAGGAAIAGLPQSVAVALIGAAATTSVVLALRNET